MCNEEAEQSLGRWTTAEIDWQIDHTSHERLSLAAISHLQICHLEREWERTRQVFPREPHPVLLFLIC